jgi:hypothetical protein
MGQTPEILRIVAAGHRSVNSIEYWKIREDNMLKQSSIKLAFLASTVGEVDFNSVTSFK